MASQNFEKVIEDVKALDSAEQMRLRGLLDLWLGKPSSEPLSEQDQLDQFLLKEGLISGIAPRHGAADFPERKAIALPGNPRPEGPA